MRQREFGRLAWLSAAIVLVVVGCSSTRKASLGTAASVGTTVPTPSVAPMAPPMATVAPTSSPIESPTPVLETIAELLSSPHPAVGATTVVSAIHTAFAADPSVTTSRVGTITEAQFTGHPATPGYQPPAAQPGGSAVTITCDATTGPCGMGFLYACAQDGMPWGNPAHQAQKEAVSRAGECQREILWLFAAYQATGHQAFYDAALALYNYSVNALPSQGQFIKAYLTSVFATPASTPTPSALLKPISSITNPSPADVPSGVVPFNTIQTEIKAAFAASPDAAVQQEYATNMGPVLGTCGDAGMPISQRELICPALIHDLYVVYTHTSDSAFYQADKDFYYWAISAQGFGPSFKATIDAALAGL